MSTILSQSLKTTLLQAYKQNYEVEVIYKFPLIYALRFYNNYFIDIKEEISNIYSDSNYKSYRIIRDNDNEILQEKTLKERININLFQTYINVKEEIDNVSLPHDWQYNTIRHRKRYNLTLSASVLSFTIITYNEDPKIFYEIELELNSDDIDSFEKDIIKVFTMLQDSYLSYTFEERKNVEQVLFELTNEKFDKNIINKPINLTYRQLSVGKYDSLIKSNNNYYLSAKADGLRKLLLLYDNYVWLFLPPFDFSLLSRDNEDFNTTIYDCEYIDKQILLFDCLWWQNKDIRNKTYKERYQYINNLQITHSIYQFNKKEIVQLSTKNFFDQIANYLQEERFTYKIDGLIFTSAATYNESVYKWKDPRDLTIDFLVQDGELQVYDEITRQMVVFIGTKQYPITDVIYPEKNGIYEFEYQNNTLQVRKYRADKNSSNTLKTATQVWQDIFHPITREDLLALNLKLVFRYHNRIKRRLYQYVYNRLQKSSTKILFDIGSGKGGDLDKWQEFRKVYALEPNLQHRLEMQRRLQYINSNYELKILAYSAQEIDKIFNKITEKVDVVSLMLSLSFFKESEYANLVNLIDATLKIHGYLIFFTIDGNSVSQLTYNKITLPGVQMEIAKNKVYINIDNSIVQEQKEYKVNIDKFLNYFVPYYKVEIYRIADGYEEMNIAPLLSNEQLLFSRLFSFFVLRKKHDINSENF